MKLPAFVRSLAVSSIVALLACIGIPPAQAQQGISDAELVATLSGFSNEYATVNSIRLHYVAGGTGSPVILLPGWPETWWSFHKIMPALTQGHRVIAVDLRGMGGSDKPENGYDKKTMAADIAALIRQLGYPQADIVGHDIGAQVAFSVAANHPDVTRRLVMLDVPHPDAQLATWPLLPAVGTFGDKVGDGSHAFAWWFAFHQVKGLPEQLLAGRQEIEQQWFFHYLTQDDASLDARDRAVYAATYASRDAIRAGNAWYQAFPQDIVDDATYARLAMPVLGLGGPGYAWLRSTLERHASDLRVVRVENSGHFIAEEQPAVTIREIEQFLR